MKYIKYFENTKRKYKKGDFVTCIELPDYFSQVVSTSLKIDNTYLITSVNSGSKNDIVIKDLLTDRKEMWNKKYFKKEKNFDYDLYMNIHKYNL
jgi:hypothetical protein